MALRTLPQWTLPAHYASTVAIMDPPTRMLSTPLDDGTALLATSPHAHAAAGEGRLNVQEQHGFPGQLNPTNQQISVKFHHQPLGGVSSVSSSLLPLTPLEPAVKGEYRCGYCQQIVLSTSGHSCGRTPRIRCDCGGIQQDGKKRLHSKWTIVRLRFAGSNEFAERQQRVSARQYCLAAVVSEAVCLAAVNIDAPVRVEAAEQVNNICASGRAPDHSIDDGIQPLAKRAKIGSCIETPPPSNDGLEELLASLRRGVHPHDNCMSESNSTPLALEQA